MAAEGNLRKKLKTRVEAYGGEIRAVSWLGRWHAPDVLCLFPFDCPHPIGWGNEAGVEMHHPFIETKAPKKGPTRGQAAEHERMRRAGCVVLVINSEERLNEWLPPL